MSQKHKRGQIGVQLAIAKRSVKDWLGAMLEAEALSPKGQRTWT
jgi:hypothetical protein